MEKLRMGTAYHGNRILKHVREDMEDIARHNMNLVVHMFTHTDWERHLGVMKDIVSASRDAGLEVWIDNWGLGGPPGDVSHFLGAHPEAHQVYSDGTPDHVSVCYNSEAFVEFTKRWLDTVASFGGDKIFWDEPHLKLKKSEGGEVFTCCCPTCRRLFEERYGHPMPDTLTDEVKEFRTQSITGYFDRVTSYAKLLGMENIVCVMLHTLEETSGLAGLANIDDYGIDPYWFPGKKNNDPYDFVYEASCEAAKKAKALGKRHHIWIQGYSIPAGYEDEIVTAYDAAYDSGARTILSWSYRGGESNTYKSENCERVWQVMGEASARIRGRYFDDIRSEKLKKYGISRE